MSLGKYFYLYIFYQNIYKTINFFQDRCFMPKRDKNKNLVRVYQCLKTDEYKYTVNQITPFCSITYNCFKSFIQTQES